MAGDTRRMGDSQGCGAESSQGYWAEIYKQYYEEVRCYIARRVKNPHDVEDLVQEVFASLIVHGPDFRNPHAYMHTLARHELYAYWRQRRRCVFIELVDFGGEDRDIMAILCDADADPLEQLSSREEQQIVGSTMNCLSPVLMEALRLRFIDDLHIGEAAVRAGCSRETLKKRLLRAKQSLADLCRESRSGPVSRRTVSSTDDAWGLHGFCHLAPCRSRCERL